MGIPFVKMHGLGNDYVYLDAVADPALDRRADLPALARAVSDRHRGVGSDGLILVAMPTAQAGEAHVRMRMFNADGSEAEMCGNGVRCVAKFAHDRLGLREKPLRVETGRGVLSIDYTTSGGLLDQATVDMGEPILAHGQIPFDPRCAAPDSQTHAFLLNRAGVACVPVSMGNPHAVFFLDGANPGAEHFASSLGPMLERHEAFPKRANIHFVRPSSRGAAEMWTWERGSGLTQACGTGACAVLVAGVLTGRLDRDAVLTLPGGDLRVRWDEASNHVFMTGPAETVCEGVWPDEPFAPDNPPTSTRPSLATERLLLRPFTMHDAADVTALAGDRRVYEPTLLIPHPYRPEHATSWISSHQREWDARRSANFAIARRDTGELVGAIGLIINARHRHAEIGYWIGPPFWGQGYATEAARAVVDFGFDRLGLIRVHSFYFSDNPASGRVMEKLGMRREGLCRQDRVKDGQARDSILYAILRSDRA